MSNSNSTNSRFAVIRHIDTPLKLFALIVIILESVMIGVAKNFEEGFAKNFLIVGAIFLLFLIIIIVAFKWKLHKPFVEKIDEGGFEVCDDQGEPDKIWQGFQKDFKSYNDPWVMELNSPAMYLKTHRERYCDPNCGKFRFLFFIKDSLVQFERFVKFQAMVHLNMKESEIDSEDFNRLLRKRIKNEDMPKTLDHIRVYLNTKDTPQQTFFIGYKNNEKDKKQLKRVALWYLSIISDTSRPHMILKITDNDFWLDLERKWDSTRTYSETVLGSAIFNRYLKSH